jgi:hypothetical protein
VLQTEGFKKIKKYSTFGGGTAKIIYCKTQLSMILHCVYNEKIIFSPQKRKIRNTRMGIPYFCERAVKRCVDVGKNSKKVCERG